MLDVLDRKIRQMHHSLDAVQSLQPSPLRIVKVETIFGFYQGLEFKQHASNAELANMASLLVANIASLKDHLKVWCTQTGKRFDGDTLINTDSNVATIHDLWNIDKHADIRNPRSGRIPSLRNLHQVMTIQSTNGAKALRVLMGPGSTTVIGEKRSMTISLDGLVVDDKEMKIGNFEEICTAAVAAWEKILADAGVTIPKR